MKRFLRLVVDTQLSGLHPTTMGSQVAKNRPKAVLGIHCGEGEASQAM
jgi:hypothetical protein